MRRLILALLATATVAGCALPTRDKLELVVDVAVLRAERNVDLVANGLLPLDVAKERLDFMEKVSKTMVGSLTIIDTCAGQGGCDVSKLRGEMGAIALDQLEERLMKAKDYDRAEAAGAAAIIVRIVSASAAPPSPAELADTSRLRLLVKRFEDATKKLAAAIELKS